MSVETDLAYKTCDSTRVNFLKRSLTGIEVGPTWGQHESAMAEEIETIILLQQQCGTALSGCIVAVA